MKSRPTDPVVFGAGGAGVLVSSGFGHPSASDLDIASDFVRFCPPAPVSDAEVPLRPVGVS